MTNPWFVLILAVVVFIGSSALWQRRVFNDMQLGIVIGACSATVGSTFYFT